MELHPGDVHRQGAAGGDRAGLVTRRRIRVVWRHNTVFAGVTVATRNIEGGLSARAIAVIARIIWYSTVLSTCPICVNRAVNSRAGVVEICRTAQARDEKRELHENHRNSYKVEAVK